MCDGLTKRANNTKNHLKSRKEKYKGEALPLAERGKTIETQAKIIFLIGMRLKWTGITRFLNAEVSPQLNESMKRNAFSIYQKR